MNVLFTIGRAALPYVGRIVPWALLGYEWSNVKDDAGKDEPTGQTKAMAYLTGAGLVLGAIGAGFVVKSLRKR